MNDEELMIHIKNISSLLSSNIEKYLLKNKIEGMTASEFVTIITSSCLTILKSIFLLISKTEPELKDQNDEFIEGLLNYISQSGIFNGIIEYRDNKQ